MEFHFFFFNDTATTEIYTLSLHDALPILLTWEGDSEWLRSTYLADSPFSWAHIVTLDRKSTRLNSSHANISYAVFCLKKKRRGQEAAAGIHPAADTLHLLPHAPHDWLDIV